MLFIISPYFQYSQEPHSSSEIHSPLQDLRPPTENFDTQGHPQYVKLLQMIEAIIPTAHLPETPHTTEQENVKVIKNVLNTAEDMYNKIQDTKRRKSLRDIIIKGRAMLVQNPNGMEEGYRLSKNNEKELSNLDVDKLLRDFGKVLKPSKSNHIPLPKAPFSKLGDDGFEDVDHQGLDAEIKSLALTLKNYLEIRMDEIMESTQQFGANFDDPSYLIKYHTDSILTQMTLEMAKIHRAVLKNQHHILMIIGNFAGNIDASQPQKNVNLKYDHVPSVSTNDF